MRKSKNKVTRQFLQNEYTINKKSCYIIAKDLGISKSTIYRSLKKFNIKIRNNKEAQEVSPSHYIDGRSLKKVFCKCGKQIIYTSKKCAKCAQLGKKRTLEQRKKISGYNHSKFKGKIQQGGYIYVYSPNHPNKNSHNYVFEHRLVMEKRVGRYLTLEERVHHINGVKTDNKIENLMLFPNMGSHRKFIHYGETSFICKFCKKNQQKRYA